MNPLSDLIRESLGSDFEIRRPLGDGQVAHVYLAREKGLDRPVAIKVMRPVLATDETARQRFLREARLAARIQHRNVVAVHRVGELDGGIPYLVMEFIDGHTYEDVLAAGGPLGEDDVRDILVEVSKALDVAHELGIIHRDIRPGNIMRTRDGERIVLADFGLAGILETGGEQVQRLTGAGQMLGDVHYAPPEQLQGEPVQPGSDIYSLAVTAYELLTGRGPFPEADKPAALIKAHMTQQPVPLRTLRPQTDPTLEDTLLRCLQKRPEQRPSATLLRQRLEGGDAAAHPADGSASAVHRFLQELKRRHVYKVGAGYGAFILVVLAVVDAALPALPFDIPAWTDTVLVTGALAGLPVALILGWFFDLSGGGIERTPEMPSDTPGRVRLVQAAALTLILALTGLLVWIFLLR